MNGEIQEKANKMAKEFVCDYAKYLGKKGIYNVYVCDFNDGKVHDAGFPLFLLEHNGEIRINRPEETDSLMNIFMS